MITPLGQRQMFMASNVEAVRMAQDVVEQEQREAGRRRVADDRLAEAQMEVPEISVAEGLVTEDREHGQPRQDLRQRTRSGGAEGEEAQDGEDEGVPANLADSHLDFLA